HEKTLPLLPLWRGSSERTAKATHREVMTCDNLQVMAGCRTDNAQLSVHPAPTGRFRQSLRHSQLSAQRRESRNFASFGEQSDQGSRTSARVVAVRAPSGAKAVADFRRDGLPR